jgi:hypothetical protein
VERQYRRCLRTGGTFDAANSAGLLRRPRYAHLLSNRGAKAIRRRQLPRRPASRLRLDDPWKRWPIRLPPIARYIRSVGYAPLHFTDINQVQFHPVIRAKMGDKWLFSMFEEKEIIYDMITQGWFVPLDFMIHWQALPNLSIALGAACSLYASYPQYENTVYGRLKDTF